MANEIMKDLTLSVAKTLEHCEHHRKPAWINPDPNFDEDFGGKLYKVVQSKHT